jgi:hypothetical protein
MKYLFLIFSLALLFTHCDCDDNPQESITDPTQSQIDLSDIKIGQRSKYLRFTGEQYGQLSGYDRYRYKEDTLVLEVVDGGNEQMDFIEYLSEGSTYTGLRDTIYHRFWIENDSLHMKYNTAGYQRSEFFTAYSLATWSNGDTLVLPLNVFDGVQAEVSGWQLDVPYSEDYREFKVNNMFLFDTSYTSLNAIINNTPMQLDGDGTTYIYSAGTGFVRSVNYGWWTQTGMGWDLLPD